MTVQLIGAGHPATLGSFNVASLPRVFDPPAQIDYPLETRFGDDLRLLGYDLIREGNAVTLTLHWQALRRMEEEYKVFVHVFDPATGSIVAQNDAVPRGWTYPTTWWEEGEFVSDEIVLSLEDVSEGRYQLAVGVYHLEGGQRLTAVAGDGAGSADSLVLAVEVLK